MDSLFPMFVKLKGRVCLVVGAGEIGEGKIAGLLDTGAKIKVVAPHATDKVKEWARAKKVQLWQREFRDSDLQNCFCVVAATSLPSLHKRIFRLARTKNILCNVVDVPDLCDFYYPAVVRRGSLQIAISTSGESPALAQRLRKKLEKQFGSVYADWLKQLGDSRRKINVGTKDTAERKAKLHVLASENAFQTFRKKRTKRHEE